jgi:nucleoid DNA-binding protein
MAQKPIDHAIGEWIIDKLRRHEEANLAPIGHFRVKHQPQTRKDHPEGGWSLIPPKDEIDFVPADQESEGKSTQ